MYATEWDLIIGSDLVYDENGVHMLPRVLAALVRPGNVAFYCHTKHGCDCLDFDFFAEVAKCGLLMEESGRRGFRPRLRRRHCSSTFPSTFA